MDPIIKYGFHTGECRHRISFKEARDVAKYLRCDHIEDVKSNTSMNRYGIDEITIISRAANEHRRKSYELVLRVNFSSLIGEDGDLIMEGTVSNIRRMIKRANDLLATLLGLDKQNSCFDDWKIYRIDQAFDIYVDHPREMVRLLNQSLRIPPSRHLKPSISLSLDSKESYESVYLKNKSYHINVYDKGNELGLDLNENEKSHILRVEKQCISRAETKKLFPSGTIGEMLDSSLVKKSIYTLKKTVCSLWGKGDFYNYEDVKAELLSGSFERGTATKDICSDIRRVVHGGRLYNQENLSKDTYALFDEYKIAPAFLTGELLETFGGTSFHGTILGLYSMIDDVYHEPKQVKKYHSFTVPLYDKKNDRYKCSFRIHPVKGEKSIRKHASGKTYEICQECMFEKLVDHFEQNRINGQDNEGIMQDLELFKKTIKSAGLKRQVDDFIDKHTKSGANWSK